MSDMYTKTEFDLKFDSIHGKLDELLERAKETNGRVGSLERWRSFIVGGMSLLTVFILPVLFFVLSKLMR